jgi:hypothetical protein
VRPLGEVVKAQMPARVRPPGVLSSYSNHGTAIAGYAVACVSGQSWEDYVEQRILKPLGMEHTSVRQPPEDQLPADMSKGYKWEDGHFEAKPFEYIPTAPAGCISASASDAAKFMLAHLNDGQLNGKRILEAEMARRMRQPLFRNNPKTSAMCYGFMEEQHNGQRIVGHGGDTFWFHSLMELFPERRVGLFVSYNTNTSASARNDLFDAFLRRYFPTEDPPRVKAASDFRDRAKRLKGEYGFTRYSHSTVAKLAALFGVFHVSVNDDDTLTISIGQTTGRYVETEPFVFRELDGTKRVVFQEEPNGRVAYLYLADVAPLAAERREWYESTLAQWSLLGASAAILASALLFWPVIAFSVRGLQSPRITRTRWSRIWSIVAWLLSALSVGFAASLAFVLEDPTEIAFGLTPMLRALLAVPQFCAGLAALTLLGCLIAWKNRYWRFSGRVHYTLVALAGIGVTWFMYHWNFLTFGFHGIVS